MVINVGGPSSLWVVLSLDWWIGVVQESRLRKPHGAIQTTTPLGAFCISSCIQAPVLCEFLLWVPFIVNCYMEQWANKLFSPSFFWSWCFIPAVESKPCEVLLGETWPCFLGEDCKIVWNFGPEKPFECPKLNELFCGTLQDKLREVKKMKDWLAYNVWEIKTLSCLFKWCFELRVYSFWPSWSWRISCN